MQEIPIKLNEPIKINSLDFHIIMRKNNNNQVNGEFLLELVHKDSNQFVARMGFNVVFYAETQQTALIVNHTPQGRADWKGFRKIKDIFLKYNNFRTVMMLQVIEIAKKLEVDFIMILGSRNHPKVCMYCTPEELSEGALISYERAIKIIDRPAMEAGFIRQADGNLYFILK